MKTSLLSCVLARLTRTSPGLRSAGLVALAAACLLPAPAAPQEPTPPAPFQVVMSRAPLEEKTAQALREATPAARPGVAKRAGFTVLESERVVLYLAPQTTWLQAQRAQIRIFRALVAEADKPGLGIAVAALPAEVRQEIATTSALGNIWKDPSGGAGRIDLALQLRGTIRRGDASYSIRLSSGRRAAERAEMEIPARNRTPQDPVVMPDHVEPGSTAGIVVGFFGVDMTRHARALAEASTLLAKAEEEAERDRADAFDSLETAAWRQWRDTFGDERVRSGMPIRDSKLTNRIADDLVSQGRFTSRAEAVQWLAGAEFGSVTVDVGLMIYLRTPDGSASGGYGFKRPVPQERRSD